MKTQIPFFLVLLILGTGCGGDAANGDDNFFDFGNSKLPETPEKFSILYSEDAGMLPEGVKISINPDSCVWDLWNGNFDKRLTFNLSESELDQIYQVFLENEFDLIEVVEEEVYDRGGSSLSITVDGTYYGVSNAGGSFIKEAYIDRYFACVDAVLTRTYEKINAQKVHVRIEVSEALMFSDYFLNINFEDGILFSALEDSLNHELIENLTQGYEVELYPGNTYFGLELLYKDSNNIYNYPAIYRRIEIVDTIYKGHPTYFFDLVNNEIKDTVFY